MFVLLNSRLMLLKCCYVVLVSVLMVFGWLMLVGMYSMLVLSVVVNVLSFVGLRLVSMICMLSVVVWCVSLLLMLLVVLVIMVVLLLKWIELVMLVNVLLGWMCGVVWVCIGWWGIGFGCWLWCFLLLSVGCLVWICDIYMV